MTFILKRTTTETFVVDLDLVERTFGWRIDGLTVQQALAMGGGMYASAAEDLLIDHFETYRGSLYGDKMFSSRGDQDTGLQLMWEKD